MLIISFQDISMGNGDRLLGSGFLSKFKLNPLHSKYVVLLIYVQLSSNPV